MSITEASKLQELGIELDAILECIEFMRETLTHPDDFESEVAKVEWFDTNREILLENLQIK